jgi:hypothetical protein
MYRVEVYVINRIDKRLVLASRRLISSMTFEREVVPGMDDFSSKSSTQESPTMNLYLQRI